MKESDLERLRFPVGRFDAPAAPLSRTEIHHAISEIEALPAQLRAAVEHLNESQLDTRYRPEGWTIRQVVHHVVDSHANSLVRFKWALTEDEPMIKAYFEDRWAELADYRLPVGPSLDQLDALHARWIHLMRSMSAADYMRGFIHPETGDRVQLDVNVAVYAWHGRHHLAHVVQTARTHGWNPGT